MFSYALNSSAFSELSSVEPVCNDYLERGPNETYCTIPNLCIAVTFGQSLQRPLYTGSTVCSVEYTLNVKN